MPAFAGMTVNSYVAPAGAGVHAARVRYTAANAWSKSAMRSSASSTPIEMRTSVEDADDLIADMEQALAAI